MSTFFTLVLVFLKKCSLTKPRQNHKILTCNFFFWFFVCNMRRIFGCWVQSSPCSNVFLLFLFYSCTFCAHQSTYQRVSVRGSGTYIVPTESVKPGTAVPHEVNKRAIVCTSIYCASSIMKGLERL